MLTIQRLGGGKLGTNRKAIELDEVSMALRKTTTGSGSGCRNELDNHNQFVPTTIQ
jgi:hypothetical protein